MQIIKKLINIQKIELDKMHIFIRKVLIAAKNMIKALKNNEDLALLVDQRDSSGPVINFLKTEYATDGFANLFKISNYDLPSLFN